MTNEDHFAGNLEHWQSGQSEGLKRLASGLYLNDFNQDLHFRELFEALGVGIGVWDCNDVYLHVNSRFCEITGYAHSQIVGRSAYEFLFPHKDVQVLKRMTARRMAGHTDEYALEMIRKDGIRIWSWLVATPLRNKQGKIIGSLAAVSDITEQKRNRDVLNALIEGTSTVTAERYFQSLAQHLARALGMKYAFVGTVLQEDPALMKIMASWVSAEFGGYETFVIADTASEFILTEGPLVINQAACDRFPRDRWLLEHAIESYIGCPIIDSSGSVLGVMSVLHDRSIFELESCLGIMNVFAARAGAELERLRSEDRRMLLETELAQSQKLEAIGQLAAGIAHDLNNSLGAAIGHLELLRSDPTMSGDDKNRSLKAALTGCEQASSLADQLLNFSRQGRYQPSKVNLPDVIDEVIALLEPGIDKGIRITRELSLPKLQIEADPLQLRQSLSNLLLNAAQSIDQEGQIVVKLETQRVSETKQFNEAASPGMFAVIHVRDTGRGIAPEHQKRIFEPFFTTRSTSGGNGLGLPSVYGVMQRHRGWISVSSALQGGTVFSLYFPLCSVEPADSTDAQSSQLEFDEKVVLVVDDEASLVKLAEKFLGLSGIKAVGFSNPLSALEWYVDNFRTVGLILLDMKMPGLNGEQCFQQFMSINPRSKIAVLSGYLGNQEADRLMDQGAIRILQKPLKYKQLVDWIKHCFNSESS
ncbi:MAG: PAS domain S-box protein [Bdellovibrionales bacterium]|nr:PAS domain S-box protein [Bdellovibrionales bacterium]